MVRKTTKDILAESFLELAECKRIDKITISEITNNCGMSQPTFYNHFKDKYDLIVWIHTNRVEKVMSKIGNENYMWKDTLLDGAKYYYENIHILFFLRCCLHYNYRINCNSKYHHNYISDKITPLCNVINLRTFRINVFDFAKI